jgi:hypothetical protein
MVLLQIQTGSFQALKFKLANQPERFEPHFGIRPVLDQTEALGSRSIMIEIQRIIFDRLWERVVAAALPTTRTGPPGWRRCLEPRTGPVASAPGGRRAGSGGYDEGAATAAVAAVLWRRCRVRGPAPWLRPGRSGRVGSRRPGRIGWLRLGLRVLFKFRVTASSFSMNLCFTESRLVWPSGHGNPAVDVTHHDGHCRVESATLPVFEGRSPGRWAQRFFLGVSLARSSVMRLLSDVTDEWTVMDKLSIADRQQSFKSSRD